MKSILMSIHPKWCEKIFNGEKTIEVRKTAPKPPFKVVVYCTKQRFPNKKYLYINETSVRSKYGVCNDWLKYDTDTLNINEGTPYQYETYFANGKVIGEFVCNEVDKYKYEKTKEGVGKFTISEKDFKDMAIDGFDLFDYADGKDIYGIHITDPILYDKPKELGEFRVTRKKSYYAMPYDVSSYQKISRYEPITRPPQSYMYCEPPKDLEDKI